MNFIEFLLVIWRLRIEFRLSWDVPEYEEEPDWTDEQLGKHFVILGNTQQELEH